MTKKRLLSAALAGVMALSALSVLSSCKKDEGPVKEKRTNVYSSSEIELPDGINYINRISYVNDFIYVTYYKEYTITYNELGEEVERREGYYYQSNDGTIVGDMDIPVAVPAVEEVAVEEVAEEEAPTEEAVDANGDGIMDDNLTVDEEQSEAGGNGEKLPEGWWFGYESVQCIGKISLADGSMTETPIRVDGDTYGYVNNTSIASDGTILALTNQWVYDETTGMGSSTYRILRIDPTTGELIEAIPMADIITAAGLDMNNSYINGLVVGTDGFYYINAESTILILDSNFKYQSQLSIDAGWISELIPCGNKMLLTYYNDGQACKFIENGQLVDVQSDTLRNLMMNYYGMIGATDEYLLYRIESGVYKYDFATDTTAEILNYINSDIDSTNAGNMVALPDGRIVMAATVWNDTGSETTLSVLTKVPDEQLEEEIIVKLGTVYNDYNLTRAIIAYNKRNTGIRIAVVSYEHYNNEENEWKGAVTQMNNDIITGKLPDLIYLSTSLPVESYFQKGVFLDLNTYIDDPEKGLNRAEYMSNIFDANTRDGKMYSLILSYSINTLFAKSEYVGTEPGWTFEDMMAAIQKLPEGTRAFFDMGRDDIVNQLFRISLNSFVDWETGETQFQSQGFIDLIKYLATCPEKGYWAEYYDSMGENYVYDEEVEREMNEKYTLRFYNNLALFETSYINSFDAILGMRNTFASKDITPIGYPTNDETSNGAVIQPNMEIAISAKSRVKDEAWEILKFFMTDETIADGNSYRFVLNRAKMEEKLANASERYYYYEQTDDDLAWYREYGYSEEYINYMKASRQPFSQEAADDVMTLIEGAKTVQRTDTDLVEIITEELSSFFAGTKSAEATAEIIASRARIYIAENS